MTSVAETRVLPESLADSWRKLTAAWPAPAPDLRRETAPHLTRVRDRDREWGPVAVPGSVAP